MKHKRGGAHYDTDGKILTGRKAMDPTLRKVPYGTRIHPDYAEKLRAPGVNGAGVIHKALDMWFSFDALAVEEQEMVLALVDTFIAGYTTVEGKVSIPDTLPLCLDADTPGILVPARYQK